MRESNPPTQSNTTATNPGDQFAQFAQSAGIPPSPAPQAQQQQQQKISLTAAIAGISRPVSADPGTEALMNFMATAEEAKKTFGDNKDFKISVIGLDRQTHQVGYFSICAVMVQFAAYPEMAAYHTLIIADSNLPLSDKTHEGTMNAKFTLPMTDNVAYDASQCQMVDKYLLGGFNSKVNLLRAHGTVVPRGSDLKQNDFVRGLLLNAVFAAADEIKRHTNQRWIFNPAKMFMDPNQTKAEFRFYGDADAIATGCDGAPYRASLVIELNHQPDRQQNGSIHNGGSVATLGRLEGHMEAIYAGSRGVSLLNEENKYRVLTPMAVFSNFHSTVERTLPNFFLTLYASLMLAKENRWMNSFRLGMDAEARGKVDLRNPGNLNVYAKIPDTTKPQMAESLFGQPMSISQAEFGSPMFVKFLNSIFYPDNMMFSVDYNHMGQSSWLLEPLMAAAAGKPRGVSEIVDTLNASTNGIFSTKFNSQQQPIFSHSMLMRAGSYEGSTKRLPLSMVDLTYVAGACGTTNPDLIRDWLETMSPGKFTAHQRLRGRDDLLKVLTNHRDVKFTGETTRLIFNSDFVMAMMMSYIAAGVIPGVIDDATSGNFAQTSLTSPWALNGLNLASIGGGGASSMPTYSGMRF